MKWRYVVHTVSGSLKDAAAFVTASHPEWDVVSFQFFSSRTPDSTDVVYREALLEGSEAPPEFWANHPSGGPPPTPSLSSPMEVLKRFWAPLTEAQIDAKMKVMTKADYEMLPGPVREKMTERTAYFQANDTNFKRPPWYEGNATHPFYPPK